MFMMKVCLSHLSGLSEVVVIALEIPETPDVIFYNGIKYNFVKYLAKSGRPYFKEEERLYE